MTSRRVPEHIYAAVAARRMQWDNLVWQVPLLSLTAQAFLYTIELGADTTRTARIIAAVLSLVVTGLCVTLMARHRQAEIFDAHWLADRETPILGRGNEVHGWSFAQARNAQSPDGGWTEHVVPQLPGYKTWIGGLLVFGSGSLVVLFLSILRPELLTK